MQAVCYGSVNKERSLCQATLSLDYAAARDIGQLNNTHFVFASIDTNANEV